MAEFYRDLVGILQANGCYLVRTGKGSQNVTVPRSTKSRHTANDVLKKAGLPKSF
jgi:hypothetical protein